MIFIGFCRVVRMFYAGFMGSAALIPQKGFLGCVLIILQVW